MRTKIVYVLTSTEQDLFLEQTLLSVYSLRLYNPDADVLLVVDDHTDKTLVGQRREILKYVSHKIVVDIPSSYNQKQRSRFLKTSLRDIVQGDFLFIDSDTIIAASLADIDNTNVIIGAVPDLHEGKIPANRLYKHYIKKMNWKISVGTYFNSGVLFCKDSLDAYTFYHNWHENWLESVKKGFFIDQPALAKTDMMLNGIIKDLNGEWNCQSETLECISFMYKAKIIHYFGGAIAKSYYNFLNNDIFKKLKDNKGILSSDVKYLVQNAKIMLSMPYTISGKRLLNIRKTFIFRCINKLYVILYRL